MGEIRPPAIISTMEPSNRINSLKDERPESSTSLISYSHARRLLVGVSSLYAVDYSINKVLQRQLKPEVVSALKYTIAAFYFLPTFFRGRIDLWSIRVGVELGVWCSIYAISLTNNITTTKASKVSFFAALGVILAPIYDLFVAWVESSRRRGEGGVNTRNVAQRKSILHHMLHSPFIAPLLAIAGVVLLEQEIPSIATLSTVRISHVGADLQDLKLLVSPVASSLCYWRSARMARSRPYDVTVVTTTLMATTGLLTSAICLYKYGLPSIVCRMFDVREVNWVLRAMSTNSGRASLFNQVAQDLAAHWVTCVLVLFSSLFATGWSTITEQRALQVLSAAETALVLSLEPLFATFYAWLLLGEQVGLNTAGAACFIISASLWGPLSVYLKGRVDALQSKNK